MNPPAWTLEGMTRYAALVGLENATPDELQRITELATRVARVSAAIPRMPSKENEPAGAFRVPL